MASAAQLPQGQEVRLSLRSGAAARGFVFCCDADSDLVIIEEPHPQSTLKQDVRFVKMSMIDKVEKLEGSRPVQEMPPLPNEFVMRRQREGLERAAKDAQRIGTGVSEQAQKLFNALDKTYNLRWEGQNIVSELGIVIKPPYTADACDGKDAAALSRFKKIVQSINQRIS